MWYQKFSDGEERSTSVQDRSDDGVREANEDAESWSRDCEDAREWEMVWRGDAAMTIDLYQGEDDQGRRFGYVHGDDGGFFFTWMDTLEKTLDSIDEDDQDGDGGLTEEEVRDFLRSKIAAKFE